LHGMWPADALPCCPGADPPIPCVARVEPEPEPSAATKRARTPDPALLSPRKRERLSRSRSRSPSIQPSASALEPITSTQPAVSALHPNNTEAAPDPNSMALVRVEDPDNYDNGPAGPVGSNPV
jgi:hypothetical protein